MKRNQAMKPILAVALSFSMLGLAGCQSSAPAEEEPAAASSESTDKAGADAYASAASAPVEFIAPGEAFDASKYKGAKIAVITLDHSLPFVNAVLTAMTEASEAAGVELDIYDAKGSPDNATRQMEQAIAAKADVIVPFGINFKLVPAAVEAANKAGIPVSGSFNIDVNAPLEEGAAGGVSIDYYKAGKSLVAWAIANTEEPVIAAHQNLPSIETFTAMRQGVEDGFAEFCPDECQLTVDDLNQANFKTAAETLTGSQIARNPKLNWVFTSTDGIAQFAIPGVELAGKQDTVRLGSQNALPAHLGYILEGRVQAVDVGVNNQWLGWGMLDRALRALDGQEAEMSEVPIKLFDADNLQGLDVNNLQELFDDVDFRAEYQALWQK